MCVIWEITWVGGLRLQIGIVLNGNSLMGHSAERQNYLGQWRNKRLGVDVGILSGVHSGSVASSV